MREGDRRVGARGEEEGRGNKPVVFVLLQNQLSSLLASGLMQTWVAKGDRV